MEDRPWLKQYDPGVPHTIEYPSVPLFFFLEEAARNHPETACAILYSNGTTGRKFTYREVNEMTDRLAAGLVELGVKKGDRVGIFMPNSPQFVVAYFAVLKAGGVVVATNPLYSPREIEHQANDSGVEIMLVMSNFYNRVKEVQSKTKIRTVVVTNIKEALPSHLALLFTLLKEEKGGHRVQLAEGDLWMKDLLSRHKASDRPQIEVRAEDVALFQYSGGTTGTSKGAVALHRNLVANTLQIRSWITDCVDGNEVVLMAIPLFHVYGMVAGMCFAIRAAGTMIMVPNPRELKDVLESIQKFGVSIYPGVPTMYNAINNHPDVQAKKYNLSTIKACISGSAPLMRETKERFEELTGGKLVEGFGMSEAPTASHCNPLYGKNPPGSIGVPMSDMDCRIISLDDEVTVLPVGEIGELVMRGPNVMRGYHNMPTETANALRDGWLYTGDIARMDEEGFFYIVDRKKELIKPGGYQVWPREVEEVIITHPKVLEVGVAGIPDPYRGETVKAWVVVKPGESLTEEEVKAFCAERLAKYKIPTHIEFRTELPKTTVGKILRRELVRQHKEQSQVS
ncbi:MAG: long-chain fatty acid--CoA ligase [Anaerolineales bacterium]|nr:long-chain fatty acid--CoA ligase [Anaerolineales bacterium]